jgi:hypothetical protein
LVISPSGNVTNVLTRGPAATATATATTTTTTTNEEESVSAIQSFIDETSTGEKVKSPSVRITSTASGVVNIKAVVDSSPKIMTTSTPRPRGRPPKVTSAPNSGRKIVVESTNDSLVGSVRNMKGVSMVTLTAGGIIKKVTMPTGKRKRSAADLDSDDEGDSDDLYEDDDETAAADGVNNGEDKKDDREYRPSRKVPDDSHDDSVSSSGEGSDANRSKRQRREKKIFDI